jgi:hypothetical protein
MLARTVREKRRGLARAEVQEIWRPSMALILWFLSPGGFFKVLLLAGSMLGGSLDLDDGVCCLSQQSVRHPLPASYTSPFLVFAYFFFFF